MLFNSYVFIYAFLPVTLIGYYLIKDNEKKLLWLTVCSYYFYSFWNFNLAFLILFSTLVDFIAGKKIHNSNSQEKRKLWLILSILTNLGLLGFFKYFNFFLDSFEKAFYLFGLKLDAPHFNIILPIGISFYTFQSMSYTIDIYQRKTQPVKNFIHFACYVSMFPQLIAGPIVRFKTIAQQLQTRDITSDRIKRGACFFILGLAKKVVIADSIAVIVDKFWGLPANSLTTSWITVTAYALQIYYDFSAYSDMAYGLGQFLGFDFPQNFNSPYKAESITDFWKRWHMSLSAWLRDFLYIPLGGNRKGPLRTYINLFITMFLGGLWHGANWTFVGWGCWHGILLALERKAKNRNRILPIGIAGRRAVTFILVLLGWVLFRSDNFSQALTIYKSLFGLHGLANFDQLLTIPLFLYVFFGLTLWITFTQKNTWEIQWKFSPRIALGLGILFLVSIFVILVNFSSPFLYYQF
ncbi:MAG: MBOAT family protein [Candidatus Omnitrophica bacterium]|nr:MBOAT family protein [Candidatus Omnitrophota bacterium]